MSKNLNFYQPAKELNGNKNLAKGTKIWYKNDLNKNKKDLLKTMVYHDSTALVFSKEVQSQMQLSLNSKAQPPSPHDTSAGSGGVMFSLESPANRNDAANMYANMQQQQTLLTPLKAKSPAFVQQVDIMPATSTSTAVTPPPPTTQINATTTTAAAPKNRGKTNGGGGNKVQFKCELCGMTFGSKSAHTSHTKSHANKGEISNKIVEHTTTSQDVDVTKQLAQIKANPNALNGSGGDPYQCNVCQKTFAVPARLIRHYRTHTGERPFECEFCHKLFSVKENLQVHRRIHTKERPYKCEVCGRAFEHSGKLHRHMRIHTGERPHKCSVCEKTFIQSGQLVIHMRTHTGEKPYKCPEEGCGKGFTCSKQLKVHSRTHTGEKPYHCDICFRDFGYNHVLKLHRVQHYGSKCYKCTICDETFKGKKEMEAHIKGHANELPSDEGGEGGGGDAATSATTTSSSDGGAIKSESLSLAEHEVLDNAVANLLEHSQSSTLGLPEATTAASLLNTATLSPISESPTSMSASYASVGSPALSGNSSSCTTIGLDAGDNNSYHSGEPKALQPAVSVFPTLSRAKNPVASYMAEELPTDLSIQQELKHVPSSYYPNDCESSEYDMHGNLMTNLQNPRSSYHVPPSPSPSSAYSSNALASSPQATINPALLEAASIASRNVMLESREHEATEAALQILQLNRSHSPVAQMMPMKAHAEIAHAILTPSHSAEGSSHFDDMYEANELINHYKRGDLARHGIHKGYVPVPKFESSLRNNDHIVRKVEAAIAPLRTSTESPERSSSPESDCMMMADRDIMTLPLRKRKIYMSDKAGKKQQAMQDEQHGNNAEAGICEMSTKVVRMSSVIQFAKAS